MIIASVFALLLFLVQTKTEAASSHIQRPLEIGRLHE